MASGAHPATHVRRTTHSPVLCSLGLSLQLLFIFIPESKERLPALEGHSTLWSPYVIVISNCRLVNRRIGPLLDCLVIVFHHKGYIEALKGLIFEVYLVFADSFVDNPLILPLLHLFSLIKVMSKVIC